jgi:hypothetical protein
LSILDDDQQLHNDDDNGNAESSQAITKHFVVSQKFRDAFACFPSCSLWNPKPRLEPASKRVVGPLSVGAGEAFTAEFDNDGIGESFFDKSTEPPFSRSDEAVSGTDEIAEGSALEWGAVKKCRFLDRRGHK